MGDKEIADNIAAVLNFVQNKEFYDKISHVQIKTTMGPVIELSL
jgi:ribosomal protein L1